MGNCFISRFFLRMAFIWVAISLSFPSLSAPQLPEPDLSWKNVSVENKKTAVFCLFRDSRGVMWLGTNSGLYFYDGAATHPVGLADSLGTQIYSIVEKENRLFLGTNNGLLTYDYLSGETTPFETPTPKEIRSLLLVGDDLWIGGLNGIWLLKIRDKKIADMSEGLPHKSVYSILRDSRGILYVGTYNGLARSDSQENRFRSVKVRNGKPDGNNLFVNCMLEADDNEAIYVGGEGWLLKYYPAGEHWEKINLIGDNNIKCLSQGDSGHILIGTDNGLFDMHGDSIRHYRHDSRQELSLADNEIWCIYSDPQHNVWAGHERGFSIASNSVSIRTIRLSSLVHSGEGNEIHSILRDSGDNLWFGGTNGAIRLSSDSSPLWFRHSDATGTISHNRVRAIFEDSDHNIWFATDGGLNRFDSAKNSFDTYLVVDKSGKHCTNWVYAIVEHGDSFWVGSFLNGIHCVRKENFKNGGGTVVSDMTLNAEDMNPDEPVIANNLVNNIIKDTLGNLWILLFRDNILVRYNPSTKNIQRYDIFELTGGYPTNICLDKTGRIWCAFKGGAVCFDTNGKHMTVRFPHTNSDESVLAVGKVGDGIWISTQSNVWRIDGATHSPTLLPIPQKSYTSIYEDPVSGKVYLGATDEIIEADTGKLGDTTDYNTIKMVLDSDGNAPLNLFDIKNGASGLKIPYGGSLTLVVSTLNYSPESVQRYMYKIAESPADTLGGWVVMAEGANTLTFSDLKMGRCSILIKTVGSPAPPIAVPLTIRPPWALSWWAITGYILIIVAGICWTVWYIRKRNLRKFREQERQAALENVERKLSFLSDISHDLKTPLSMIMGPVSIMKENTKDPESKRNLDTIYDNAVRLNNMIHRTLELQHLEDSDEGLLILSVFDVVEFCKGVFEAFRENNPQKNFFFHSSCTQLLIEADAVKFESVMTNLLSNACKYSDEGSTISCGICRHHDSVEIVVADDGVGIADTDQALVFQRMFRSPATSRLKEGTGLGLYLIKKYLELMNGNINLYSREGQGTSFVVSLPLSEKILPSSQTDMADVNNGKAKILIVEDNAQIAAFLTEILKKEGYSCLSAENGRSALSIAASFLPDLIIADEMMPIMTGLEMARRMKQHPRLSAIPIIMLTAKSDNKTENESIKLGIDSFMPKPFEPSSLLGRVAQMLKSRCDIKEKIRIQTLTEAEARPIEAESVNEKLLAKIARTIEENIADPDLNVNLLCEKSGVANKQLYRLVKKYLGLAPLDYIRSVRLQKAAVLLSQRRFTISEISYMVGFKTPSYFAKCFQSHFGVKPSQYRSDDETAPKKSDEK